MDTFAEEVLSCMLRSFCPEHAISFERFHSKFPKFQAWLENPASDKSVLYHVFPVYPHTMTIDKWNFFSSYLSSEEGAEYRKLCQHWPKYAKLCLEGCNRCYLKAEGIEPKSYMVDRMCVMAGCTTEEGRERMRRVYPENYGAYFFRKARKRKRFVEDWESFLVAPDA